MLISGSTRGIDGAMAQVAPPTIPADVTVKSAARVRQEWVGTGLIVERAPYGVTVDAIGAGCVASEINTVLINDRAVTEMVAADRPAGRWGDSEKIVASPAAPDSDEGPDANGHVLIVAGGMSVACRWRSIATRCLPVQPGCRRDQGDQVAAGPIRTRTLTAT